MVLNCTHEKSYQIVWPDHIIKNTGPTVLCVANTLKYLHVSHLEFLFIGDFIRQAPNPIVSPVHPQPGNLLNQGFIPPSVVPEQQRRKHIRYLQLIFECWMFSFAVWWPHQ